MADIDIEEIPPAFTFAIARQADLSFAVILKLIYRAACWVIGIHEIDERDGSHQRTSRFLFSKS
jgi:hypothetical protein